ncbi:hypothetical protein Hanom_Chr02g00123691 [Helianthus anomalus]
MLISSLDMMFVQIFKRHSHELNEFRAAFVTSQTPCMLAIILILFSSHCFLLLLLDLHIIADGSGHT